MLFESYLNDGYCDELTGEEYNSASCSWDGGDCCESTCITSLYTCGYSGYNCKDESASDFLNGTCAVHASTVGDGYCDAFYYSSDAHLNTEACGWDGGDCCPSTCVGDCDHVVYECKDPEARDYNTTSDCHAPHPSWLADGYCDDDGSDSGSLYNSGVCSWDGGDCCATTCVDGTYTCGLNHDSTRYRYVTRLFRPIFDSDGAELLDRVFCLSLTSLTSLTSHQGAVIQKLVTTSTQTIALSLTTDILRTATATTVCTTSKCELSVRAPATCAVLFQKLTCVLGLTGVDGMGATVVPIRVRMANSTSVDTTISSSAWTPTQHIRETS